jgi:hypothetical protein
MRKEAYEGFLATGNCKEAPWETEWSAERALNKTPVPAE